MRGYGSTSLFGGLALALALSLGLGGCVVAPSEPDEEIGEAQSDLGEGEAIEPGGDPDEGVEDGSGDGTGDGLWTPPPVDDTGSSSLPGDPIGEPDPTPWINPKGTGTGSDDKNQ